MSHTETLRRKVTEQLLRNQRYCERVLKMFSLFSNRTRFRILCVLKEGDFCVNDIVEFVGGKHSNISQQLKMLTLAGYLTKERQERLVFYHLEDEKIKATIDFLCHLHNEA
jgi:DNA-binding transcriptional ArsR family regulator